MTPCSESGLFESLSSPVVGGKARLLWQVGNIIRRKTSFGFCNASMMLLGNGSTIELACRGVGVSTASYYKWRQRYEGMSIDDAKELKELRTENSKLKRLVAEAELEKMMLREIAKGKF